ncbi:sugar ABC transporter ATP-binding protein [Salinarimonas ramus]|uniref:ABC transporter ATP-binding protein n=1 Tax=Salinarimonas ramus TaxID=690164 RepID=A0A917QC90_9HYPH|nr:sugar ABC transporter ATP-binding protein [Salinarimonas ramus]GGK40293.1 ABC transporter ATP-binding protein [Salinarimonas ramus]
MAPVLSARDIAKAFGPIEVLTDIDLDLEPGRVHAVIGENGAGKSTLMRILSGHLAPTRGRLVLDGRDVSFTDPVAAEEAGIVLVHQEILLAPDLSVAQNLFLGREPRRGLFADDAQMERRAAQALAELGADYPPDAPVRRLSIAERQLAQIARALVEPYRLVIMDEPTAVLTPIESEALFAAIDRLRASGTAILYISHRLPEVKRIADTVTVLRDGRHVTTRPCAELEPLDMARLMVGRELTQLFPEKAFCAPDAPVLLEAERVSVPGFAEDVSFGVRAGEILGFGGLIGAGRTEVFEGVMGLRKRSGTVRIGGRALHARGAGEAFQAGLAYLSEDRKGKGLLLNQSLATNLTLAALARFTKGAFIDAPAERRALDRAFEEFDIRAGSRDLLAGELSGGNQQKLLLAKMMLLEPNVVVIDEPTRGIDIGTKQQIYAFVAALAAEGKAVVVISSEMPELIGLAHRVIVMRHGRIAGEVAGDRLNEQDIVTLATGVGEGAAAAA